VLITIGGRQGWHNYIEENMGVVPIFLFVVCVNMDECTGCGLCNIVCPDIAIEVWRED